MAASNPLSPDAIVQSMADALPTHQKDDTTSDLSGSYEALALFTHACLVNLGFRLVGLSEDRKNESECQELAPRLPAAWNASFNAYTFVYAHTQSAMTFTLKVDRMGQRAEVRGIASDTDRVVRVDVSPRDYVSSAALPVRISLLDDGAAEDRSDLPDKLRAVFISNERIADFASLVKVSIVQRLVPGLDKPGYQEDPDDRAAEDDARRPQREAGPANPDPARGPQQPRNPGLPDPARPYPFDDPLAAPPQPRRPVADFPPPDFEDEYEINRPHGRGPLLGMGDGRSPFNIGHDDLHPPGLGPHDPLRPSFAGGLPRPGGGFGGGGMHPTFDDPLFSGGPRGGSGEGGRFDPQVPPGARYDPVGPGDDPFGGRRGNRGPFGGGGGRGSGGSPFGGGGGGFGFGGDII
ncbi:hypothetical protein MCOR25_002834 [Pyricularia grisea]|nr:hypothetical protein MCOR25_002834 [Pyricularia grisea]